MKVKHKIVLSKILTIIVSISVVCALFVFHTIANNEDNELISYYDENTVVYDKDNKLLNITYRDDITPTQEVIDNYVLDVVLKNGMYMNSDVTLPIISGINENNEVVPFELDKQYTLTYYDEMGNVQEENVRTNHMKISFIEDVEVTSISVTYDVTIDLNAITDILPECESILTYGEVNKTVSVPYEFTYDEIVWEDVDTKITAEIPSYLNDDLSLQVNKVDSNSSEYESRLNEVQALNNSELDTLLLYDVDVVSNEEKVVIEEASTSMNIELKTPVTSEVEPVLLKANEEETLEVTNPLNVEMNDKEVKTVTFDSVNYETYGIGVRAIPPNHDGTGKTFIGDGGEYTIEYILSNYNVFTFDYYTGTHVVGPMAVGGNTTITGAGGVTGESIPYSHTVPSYFKGSLSVNTVITHSNVPLYLGLANQDKSFYLVGDNGEYSDYYFTDDYIDFPTAMDAIKEDGLKYQKYNGLDNLGNTVNKISIGNDIIENVISSKKPFITDEYKVFLDLSGMVVIQLKLGNNYDIESFTKVGSIVYDYNNLENSSQLTTIISTHDEAITPFPSIYKTKDDELGHTAGGTLLDDNGMLQQAYQVDSIESGQSISVLYLCLEAKTINVGGDGSSGNTGKLTGHLVAPDASVNISSGDYNGCLIAKDVRSSAEGHMWPFKGFRTPGSVKFDFNKTINGMPIINNQQFKFHLGVVSSPENAIYTTEYVEEKYTRQDGKLSFVLDEFNVAGDYIFVVNEVDSEGLYQCNPGQIYVKVNVSVIMDGKDSIIQVNSLDYYTDIECTEESKIDTSQGQLPTFNNTSNTSMTISKVWKYSNNNVIPDDELSYDNVKVKLYRQAYEKNFKEVKFRILHVNYDERENKDNFVEITTISKQLPKDLTEFNMTIDSIRTSSNRYTDGVYFIDSNNESEISLVSVENKVSEIVAKDSIWTKDYISDSGGYYAKTTAKISNVIENTIIDIVYVGDWQVTDKVPDKDNFKLTTTVDDKFISLNPIGEEEECLNGVPIELTRANGWKFDIPNLQKEGIIDDKEVFYKYYVKESPLPGFDVSYSVGDFDKTTGTGSSNGEEPITITNKEKENYQIKELKLTKVDAANGERILQGAVFRMYLNVSDEPLKFSKLANGVYYYDEINGSSDLVTNSEGIIDIRYDSLPGMTRMKGDYILKEVYPPPGYAVTFNQIKLHFDEEVKDCSYQVDNNDLILFKEHGVHEFTVENSVPIELPGTGTKLNKNLFYMIGGILTTISLIMLGLYKKNKTKTYKGRK